MTLPNSPYLIGIVMSTGMALVMSLREIPSRGFKRLRQIIHNKLVYTVKIYQYDELFYILEDYLFKNYYKQYKDVEASLDWGHDFSFSQGPKSYIEGPPVVNDSRKIFYKQEDNMFVIKYKGRRIVIDKGSEKMEKTGISSLKDLKSRKYTLTGYRCKDAMNQFLEGIFEEFEKNRPKAQVKIRVSTSFGEWMTFDDLHVKSIDRVFLPEMLREDLCKDVDQFLKGEKWYTEVGIPYKRGYCLYGAPGNGKTTLSLSLASKIQRDVHVLNIGSLTDDAALQRAFGDLRRNSILLIEDIDKAFVKREASKHEVSFSVLLNLLDGALSKHGLIVIITTNHVEHLDPALLRDGRIDFKVEIPNPDNRMISDYLSLFYQNPITLEGNTPENERMCMASVQEICVRNRNDPNRAKREIISKIIGENLDNSDLLRIFTLQRQQLQECSET